MNILWLTNIPLPEASILMGQRPLPYGGWLVNSSVMLSKIDGVNLSVAFPQKSLDSTIMSQGSKIAYYSFPQVNNKLNNTEFLEGILLKVKPDLVHIFGTEFSHSLAMVNICRKKNIKTTISIQGLASVIARHFMANLPSKVQTMFTFRDFILQDNIKQQQKKFVNRGIFEIKALQKVDTVIGRTTWDRACTSQINPNIEYYHLNEILRREFYNFTWDINKCEKHSIFLSQGFYPIKGLHFMLEAMPILLEEFPNVKLYIGGPDITKSNSLIEKLKITSYGMYIKKLISKFRIEDKVIFTGTMDERQMCKRYLNSNVFVCPSAIENSPNSLGEAMLLGLPCVASGVGGISDLLTHKEEGFIYQTDAPYMLAYYISEIFRNEDLALKFSLNARKRALKTYDPTVNTNRLLEIYEYILQKKEQEIEK
jgi:glycosyltransferase involved in cell wall biosynthesis